VKYNSFIKIFFVNVNRIDKSSLLILFIYLDIISSQNFQKLSFLLLNSILKNKLLFNT